MSEEEMKLEENFEHEVIDRLHLLDYEDFNTDKLDDSYIVAMLKARNIILNLYNKEKEKNKELQIKVRYYEDIMIKQNVEREFEALYKDLHRIVKTEYVSKDKIREKIEEIEKILNENEGIKITNIELVIYTHQKNILEKLLEE